VGAELGRGGGRGTGTGVGTGVGAGVPTGGGSDDEELEEPESTLELKPLPLGPQAVIIPTSKTIPNRRKISPNKNPQIHFSSGFEGLSELLVRS
jgi:hypothetical protein